MIEHDPGHSDAEHAGIGEVGEPHQPGRMLLPEDHVMLGAFECPPRPDAPLQRAPDARADLGPPSPDLAHHGDRPDTGAGLEDRHHLAVPDINERIGPPPAARRLLLRWQARISLDPVARRPRNAGFGRRDVDGVSGWSETHVQPHLVVGDVEAGQMLIPRTLRRISSFTRPLATARRDLKTRRRGARPPVGLKPSRRPSTPAQSHPD